LKDLPDAGNDGKNGCCAAAVKVSDAGIVGVNGRTEVSLDNGGANVFGTDAGGEGRDTGTRGVQAATINSPIIIKRTLRCTILSCIMVHHA
jgi:hypothetical protein